MLEEKGIDVQYVSWCLRIAAFYLILTVGLVASANVVRAQDNAELAKRIDQLAEQIIDLKVEIGTLESLARSRPVPSSQSRGGFGEGYGTSSGGGNSARIGEMETQIRALTTQIESLSREVRSLRGQVAGARPGPGYANERTNWGSSTNQNNYGAQPGGFGSTTVTTPGSGGVPQDGGYAARNAPSDGGHGAGGYSYDPGPQNSYETAYGYLLQQDYGAAQKAFSDFLARYPNDRLAGNAQYWLGETYYVRGQYRPAASAFLKGYKNYAKSQKAPDSLLKLAMSLNKLGQKDAACSSFSELSTRFPRAPSRISNKARAEKRRAGC